MRKSAETLIPCAACKGSGKTPLKSELKTTLALFVRGAKLTAEQAHARLGNCITVNAINNRLEDLRALGLLQRQREGRSFIYSRA